MKYLFGFADTEGVPNRKNSKSNIWDMAIVFKYVFNGEPPWDTREEIFHICQFSCPKWSPMKSIGAPLASFQNSIRVLLHYHSCDRLCLCFWNAPHDRSVLRTVGVSDLYTLDLMQAIGKSKLDGPHFALGDVHKMLEFNMHPRTIIEKTKPPLHLQHETSTRRTRASSDRKQETEDLEPLTKNFASLSIAYATRCAKPIGAVGGVDGPSGECATWTSRKKPSIRN